MHLILVFIFTDVVWCVWKIKKNKTLIIGHWNLGISAGCCQLIEQWNVIDLSVSFSSVELSRSSSDRCPNIYSARAVNTGKTVLFFLTYQAHLILLYIFLIWVICTRRPVFIWLKKFEGSIISPTISVYLYLRLPGLDTSLNYKFSVVVSIHIQHHMQIYVEHFIRISNYT
jgi:hypothetical protein